MKRRVFISGTSGIGKTTLAQALAVKKGLPFITGSGKVLWPSFGIQTHAELINMCATNPRKGLEYQFQLLGLRRDLMSKHEEFVTDRSIIDNMAYTIIQLGPYISNHLLQDYIDECMAMVEPYDTFIVLNLDDRTISDGFKMEDDNKRVKSIIYGKAMSLIIKSQAKLIDKADNGARVMAYSGWNWNARLNVTNAWIDYLWQKQEMQ